MQCNINSQHQFGRTYLEADIIILCAYQTHTHTHSLLKITTTANIVRGVAQRSRDERTRVRRHFYHRAAAKTGLMNAVPLLVHICAASAHMYTNSSVTFYIHIYTKYTYMMWLLQFFVYFCILCGLRRRGDGGTNVCVRRDSSRLMCWCVCQPPA